MILKTELYVEESKSSHMQLDIDKVMLRNKIMSVMKLVIKDY